MWKEERTSIFDKSKVILLDNLGQIYFVKLPSFWLKRKVIGKEEETLLARELLVLLRMKTLIFS